MNNTWIIHEYTPIRMHVHDMYYACVLYTWVRALSYFYTCVAIFQRWNSHSWPLGGPKHVLQMSVLLAQAQELSVEVSWVCFFYSGFLVLQSRQFQQFQQGRWESLYPSGRPPELDSRDSYPAPWPHKFARSEALRTGHHVLHRECRFDRAYSRFEVMSTWLVGGDYLKWLIL